MLNRKAVILYSLSFQMSWEDHIKSMMAAQENNGHCAITGVDGNIWAKSSSCPLTIPEAQALIALAAAGDPDMNKRYTFGGIKLMFIGKDVEDVTIYRLATVSSPERSITDDEKGLLAMTSTGKAAVFAFLSGPNQRKASDSCLREGKYLKESGM